MSGIFDVSNGHIYFGNNVIKIRYDLIQTDQKMQFTESQIFDEYYGILQIDSQASVKSETPINSTRGHRLAYVISNKI